MRIDGISTSGEGRHLGELEAEQRKAQRKEVLSLFREQGTSPLAGVWFIYRYEGINSERLSKCDRRV